MVFRRPVILGEGLVMVQQQEWKISVVRRSFFCCAVLLLAASSCSRDTPSVTSSSVAPVTLTIGFPNVTGQDPQRGIQQAARLISSEGLVSLSRNGRAQPRLAERWTSSADGLMWTIFLRHNAVFHDGTPVDAQSVKQSLERSLANADRSLSPGLADILSIETGQPYQLVIRLKERSTFLIDDLTVPITRIATKGTAIGTGPYVLANSVQGEITMDVFPQYYRGTPGVSRVIWRAYPTVRTAWAAMMRGDVDFLYEVGQDAREFIEGETTVNVFPFLRNYVYAVIFNSKREMFRDARVRTALSLAIDRSRIVRQAFNGHARATSGSAWPEHWAFDSSAAEHPYDPARAAALLDAAGIQSAQQRTTGRPAGRIHFSCLFPENLTLWERIALVVQRNLAEVGVDMSLESVPIGEFNRRLAAGNFDTVLLELIVGNSASRPFTFWHSQSTQNMWGYKSAEVDAALDSIRRAPTDNEYREAFRDFQNGILHDPPAIFLALGETSRAVSRRFQVSAAPATDILPTISDWKLGTRVEGAN